MTSYDAWKTTEPDDGEYRGERFTCPQCAREFHVSPAEGWPGIDPLCDSCIECNNSAARREQEADRPLVRR